MRQAVITGTGYFVPDNVVTNDDLTRLMDTSDAWIVERSGIRERRWLRRGADGRTEMTGSEMGAAAARDAVLQSPRVMTWARRTFAASFAGLGLKLALERA